MLPAHQRLGPDDLKGLDVHYRLVVQTQLPALQGMAQRLFELQPLHGLLIDLRPYRVEGAAGFQSAAGG